MISTPRRASTRSFRSFKGSYADTLNAGIAAFRAGNAPGIMQVFEVGTATMMAAKGAIKPVSELMKEQGEAFDPKILPAGDHRLLLDREGRHAVVPLQLVEHGDVGQSRRAEESRHRRAAEDLAGSVRGRQEAACDEPDLRLLVELGDLGLCRAVLGLAQRSRIGTKANGLDGFDTVLKFNTPLEIKLLENLVELQKDKSYDYSGRTNTGEGRFTSGECGLYMTSSAFFRA